MDSVCYIQGIGVVTPKIYFVLKYSFGCIYLIVKLLCTP